MSQHTPGPWLAIEGDTLNGDRPWGICRHLSRAECQLIDGEAYEYPSRTEVIAEVCGGADAAVVKADATLMAASPDLLDALTQTENIIRNILTDSQLDQRTECGRTIRQWSTTVKAAINKATTH